MFNIVRLVLNTVQNCVQQGEHAMRLKRLFASVSAGFEDFVTKVENHEAVASCAIDELRAAAARVRVQHARLLTQIDRLEAQRRRAIEDEASWERRAVALADQDEAKALECVRRAERSRNRCDALAAQIGEQTRLAEELRERLTDLEARLAEVELKRTALSSRAVRAAALSCTRSERDESIDAAFDRWETTVLADEYGDAPLHTASDPLEQELRSAEEQARLETRLAELKSNKGGDAG
jgi:phage shock protein A